MPDLVLEVDTSRLIERRLKPSRVTISPVNKLRPAIGRRFNESSGVHFPPKPTSSSLPSRETTRKPKWVVKEIKEKIRQIRATMVPGKAREADLIPTSIGANRRHPPREDLKAVLIPGTTVAIAIAITIMRKIGPRPHQEDFMAVLIPGTNLTKT